ncbi:MAG TPA: site-2 protease family protein [Nitrospirota bacterium]|nr:site-2 protease family protein [Nitrospirota bacterium]
MFISIISFIAVFTVVVLVHELGHFIAARRAGVKVYEFSIGFPFSPRIITLFKHRETEFTLRLLPLGGFVSFSKDGDENAADLFGASMGHRALIMSAGSFFNIGFAFLIFIAVFVAGKHMPMPDAIAASAKTVWSVVAGTFDFIIKAFSGHGSWEGLSGPVGIAVIAGKAAAKGALNLLYFSGMLSMSLGIMNLLPFPALDGGQLLMLLVEIIRKKPLSLRTYQAVNLIGIALFLILTVVATYRDIAGMFV